MSPFPSSFVKRTFNARYLDTFFKITLPKKGRRWGAEVLSLRIMLSTFTFYQLGHAHSTIIRPSLEPTGTYQESSYYIEVASDIAMWDPAALRRQVGHPESSVDNNLADSSPKTSLTSRASPEPEITETKVGKRQDEDEDEGPEAVLN
jgi:hypothetical protein